MAESAYTKGPLIARPDPRENGEWEVVKRDGDDGFWFVAALFPAADGGTPEGNAKLYAAAPDLVEALASAKDDILQLLHMRGCEAEGSDEEWVGYIDAALSRALGKEG